MNERIRKLQKQSSIEQWDPDTGCYRYILNPEKFAELIVKECMTTVLKESKWYWDKDEFESSNAIQNAARRVKEHFGVSE